MTRAAEKARMWVKNVTDSVFRFYYLNIPWLRINITFIFMSFSRDEFMRK